MNPDDRPSKREAFLTFLKEGWVSIHLDARRDGVRVPDDLASSPHLVLQYGRDMPVPIPDLDVSEEGVAATLSFARTPHSTFIPWGAVYIVASTEGQGILYYEDVPEEVSLMARTEGEATVETAESAGEETHQDAPERSPKDRILKIVPDVPADAEAPDGDNTTRPAARRRKRPQLKIVK